MRFNVSFFDTTAENITETNDWRIVRNFMNLSQHFLLMSTFCGCTMDRTRREEDDMRFVFFFCVCRGGIGSDCWKLRRLYRIVLPDRYAHDNMAETKYTFLSDQHCHGRSFVVFLGRSRDRASRWLDGSRRFVWNDSAFKVAKHKVVDCVQEICVDAIGMLFHRYVQSSPNQWCTSKFVELQRKKEKKQYGIDSTENMQYRFAASSIDFNKVASQFPMKTRGCYR